MQSPMRLSISKISAHDDDDDHHHHDADDADDDDDDDAITNATQIAYVHHRTRRKMKMIKK